MILLRLVALQSNAILECTLDYSPNVNPIFFQLAHKLVGNNRREQ